MEPNQEEASAPNESNQKDPIVSAYETTPITHHLTGAKLYSVIFAVCISGFLMSLDISLVATAIPSITSHFRTTADIGWYGAAYPLSVCALQPISGKLATIFSLRWVFQAFFLTFLLGSLICGVAASSKMFIVGRAIAGMGGAGISSGAMSIIATVSPPKTRPILMGILMGLFSIGLVVGPLIGGALTQHASWRWCFYMNLPAGAVTVVVLLLFLHPPRTAQKEPAPLSQRIGQLDLFGCLLFASSMIMLFLALQWGGGEHAWKSGTIIGLFVGFGIVLALFLAWEWRQGDHAMIPFSLMRRRSMYFSVLYIGFIGGATVVPIYYLPEWFQIIKGVGPTESGVRSLSFVISQMLTMIIMGGLARNMKYLNPFAIFGAAVMCVASGLFTMLTAFSTPASRWITFPVVQGIGSGTAAQTPMLLAPHIVKDKPADIPLAMALILFAQFFGNSTYQAIAAAIFKNQLAKNLAKTAGLTTGQIVKLFDAGNREVRTTVDQNFPDKLRAVLTAYNGAITRVFWLELAGAAVAFFISFGIEWLDTSEKEVPKVEEKSAEVPDAMKKDIAEKV